MKMIIVCSETKEHKHLISNLEAEFLTARKQWVEVKICFVCNLDELTFVISLYALQQDFSLNGHHQL